MFCCLVVVTQCSVRLYNVINTLVVFSTDYCTFSSQFGNVNHNEVLTNHRGMHVSIIKGICMHSVLCITYTCTLQPLKYGFTVDEPERAPHRNGPRARNNSIYVHVFLYHLPRVCCTLVPEICVCPEILRVFRYIDVLACVDLQLSIE